MKNVYFVWAHPRKHSLTGQIVESMKAYSLQKGLHVTELDLYRAGFNPVLQEIDEPVWDSNTPAYSQEVNDLFAELSTMDVVFFVFPVWWYSVPAMMKGYIERVWNLGLAYGNGNKLPVKKIRWIALTGERETSFAKRDNDKYMRHYTVNSISSYCGVKDANIEFLYDTIGYEGTQDQTHYDNLFKQANAVVDEVLNN